MTTNRDHRSPDTATWPRRVRRGWHRVSRFALVYRAVLVVAVATAFEASAAVSTEADVKAGDADDRPSVMFGFEMAGGTGGTTTIVADRAARRASSAYSSGAALAEFGWGRKDGASVGLAAAMLSFHQLTPKTFAARTYEGAGLGPFVRYGRGRFFTTGVLAIGSFDLYGDPDHGGYDHATEGDDDLNSRRHPEVGFTSLKLGLGLALYQTKNFELAVTAAVMPTWTNAPHGDDELARRFASSEVGLALNFYPRPEARDFGEPSFHVVADCVRYSYACSDLALHGTKALLDAGSLLGRGLAEGLLRAILRH